MTSLNNPRGMMAAASLLAGLFTGCADGIIPEIRSMNPWVRKQWTQDEQFGATYHRKVADLAALRSTAKAMTPAEQERVAQEMVRRMQDEQSAVMRIEYMRTLGELAAPSAQFTLQAGLADENPQVRLAACKALGRQPTEENLKALSGVLTSDNDGDVRLVAARVLGQFPDSAAAQALRPALEDNDPAIQHTAMQSLHTITGRTQYGYHVPTWKEYLDGSDPAPPPGPTVAESLRKYLYW